MTDKKQKIKMNHQYAKEVRERWGDTGAYKESERRTADYDLADWNELSAGMDTIMAGNVNTATWMSPK